MCVVSMVLDHYRDKWEEQGIRSIDWTGGGPTQLQFDQLKLEVEELRKEVLNMKELLKKAKIYDEENGQPDCEMEEKLELVRKVAEIVGVDLDI